MGGALPESQEVDAETQDLRQARALLVNVVRELRAFLEDELLMEETPIEI